MEHTITSTMVREQCVEAQITDLAERRVIQTPQDGPLVQPPKTRSLGPRTLSEGRLVFLLSFGLYFAVAWLLDLKYRTFWPDSVSRMANGFYILYSRDPHLAAVGFVWEPLQSIADAVFLIGNHLWPALSHNNMAGSLVSALAMAGAAYQICAALREWDVSRVPRLVLTAFVALNPLVMLYGGNGVSEGLYVFTLVASTRYLLRWVHKGDLRSLAYAGVALGFGYLTRNEAVGGVALGAIVVGLVSLSRADGTRLSRVKTAMADLAIFVAPPFIAAAGWAITSFVITGEFFAAAPIRLRQFQPGAVLRALDLPRPSDVRGTRDRRMGARAAHRPSRRRHRGRQAAGRTDTGSLGRARRSTGIRRARISGQQHSEPAPVLRPCLSTRGPAPRQHRGCHTEPRTGSGRSTDPNRPSPKGLRRLGCSGWGRPRTGGHDSRHRHFRIRVVQPEDRHLGERPGGVHLPQPPEPGRHRGTRTTTAGSWQ